MDLHDVRKDKTSLVYMQSFILVPAPQKQNEE